MVCVEALRKLTRHLCDAFNDRILNCKVQGQFTRIFTCMSRCLTVQVFHLEVHVDVRWVIILCTIVVKRRTSRHAICGMLHPTLFPASLHAIDISDMNSYRIVRPSLIASVESDLMKHLHGLSTFLTSNNSETWHGTGVDACQSWQRPRGYKRYKQANRTQKNLQINGLRCKSVRIGHGTVDMNILRPHLPKTWGCSKTVRPTVFYGQLTYPAMLSTHECTNVSHVST